MQRARRFDNIMIYTPHKPTHYGLPRSERQGTYKEASIRLSLTSCKPTKGGEGNGPPGVRRCQGTLADVDERSREAFSVDDIKCINYYRLSFHI